VRREENSWKQERKAAESKNRKKRKKEEEGRNEWIGRMNVWEEERKKERKLGWYEMSEKGREQLKAGT
jgi:hypothetical protein